MTKVPIEKCIKEIFRRDKIVFLARGRQTMDWGPNPVTTCLCIVCEQRIVFAFEKIEKIT